MKRQLDNVIVLWAKIQVKFVRPFWCNLATNAYQTKMYQRKHFLLNFTCYHTRAQVQCRKSDMILESEPEALLVK